MSLCRKFGTLSLFLLLTSAATIPPTIAAEQPPLPNGKLLAGVGAAGAPVGSLPDSAVAVDAGRYAVISDLGERESLTCIDMHTGKAVGKLRFPTSTADSANGLYYGLAAAGDIVYASQGAAGTVAMVQVETDGSLRRLGTLPSDGGGFAAGAAIDGQAQYLYVVDNDYYDVLSATDARDMAFPGGLRVYDLGVDQLDSVVPLGEKPIAVRPMPVEPSSFPLAVAALASGKRVFVTSERDGVVYVVDTSDPTNPQRIATIATGSHPDAAIVSPDQKTLYVANAGSDTVSIIDTATDKLVASLSVRPAQARGYPGETPTALALSPDGRTLYVALGDMNAVAVVDLAGRHVRGYIPAGWYPSALVASGKKLLIVDAKGDLTRHPNASPQGPHGDWGTYVLNIVEGTAHLIDAPDPAQLAHDTALTMQANRFSAIRAASDSKVSAFGLESGKITHVIYIVKENRTYDQVLGDMPQGNGDPSLTLFGKNVTPNQHALAARFVLLDNFFDCGDVSGEGWPWSTGGMASDYVFRNVPYSYSGRGRQYDYEGQNNGYITGGFPADSPYGAPLSSVFPKGLPALPDVAESAGGHIWDLVRAAGLTYRNYGFFLSFGVKNLLPDNYPNAPGLQPAGHDLGGTTDIDFRRFDLDYPDSNAGAIYFARDHNPNDLHKTSAYGHYAMPSRYAEWRREFDEMIAADPTGAKVPAFMTVRFMMDHTSGAASGEHSPRSDVADNDYAVGELVDHVSRSPIWKHTAIFIIEDDAQDGQDHVDAHRSTCYVISPYIKAHTVDSRFYNTDSVLHTIELLLRLHPMTQYDAIASPIDDFTAAPENAAPYSAILPAESIIAQINPSAKKMSLADPRRALAVASDKMNFARPDCAPADELDTIVWKTVKGVASNPPPPRHTIFPAGNTDAVAIAADTGAPSEDDAD